ncbi:MAG TPA: BON domain-containing protein [Bryobacterales bacterium]|nr:BON domain-containing protein [Bryobacterales bacterium]
MKAKLEMLGVVLLLSALAGAPLAQAAKSPADDATLTVAVTKRLRDANFDSVGVAVNNHLVMLTGAVDRLAKAERAAQIAKKTHGVTAVENDIRVLASRSDEQIAADLTHQIRMFPFYDIFDYVTGDVKDGVVTLRGAVHLPQRYNDYANLAKQVSGVAAVKNQLEVLPNSFFDDQIRVRVARAIYGSPDLRSRYGFQALPPIHIIVKNGDVRLEGVVANQLDKQLVERAARFAGTYFRLEDNLQVEQAARA